jgi:sterol desaturase/sphingolipid hydroxylase (fatty acid hydroxylase superfamily)
VDPVLSLPAEHKAIATGLALAILWTAEHVAPAYSQGAGGWRHDLRNLALGASNALIVAGLLAWLAPWPPDGSGLLGWIGASGGVTLVVGLVALDLWMYGWHRLNHAVPFLWRFHRMHHADPSVDASSAVRFHPGEVLLGTAGRVPVALLVGLSAGHIVLYEAILLPVILFHHSNMRVPRWLDRALGVVIVTPSLHRIHHSPARHETDSNFASVLSVWDRLARTRTAVRGGTRPRYGLSEFDPARFERLTALLRIPFQRVSRASASEEERR